jgi:membrane-associated phospholipid phosphatase
MAAWDSGAMGRPSLPLILSLAAFGLLLGAVALRVAGPLPGDLALTRALQGAFDPEARWAQWTSSAARMPALAGVALVAALVAAWLGGWRAGVALLVATAMAYGLDLLLRALIHAPRPSPDLVAVLKPAATSGLPSSFALLAGATLGFVALAARYSPRRGAGLAGMSAAALLLVGLGARVLLGGHWPSQVIASVALSLSLAAGLVRLARPNI